MSFFNDVKIEIEKRLAIEKVLNLGGQFDSQISNMHQIEYEDFAPISNIVIKKNPLFSKKCISAVDSRYASENALKDSKQLLVNYLVPYLMFEAQKFIINDLKIAYQALNDTQDLVHEAMCIDQFTSDCYLVGNNADIYKAKRGSLKGAATFSKIPRGEYIDDIQIYRHLGQSVSGLVLCTKFSSIVISDLNISLDSSKLVLDFLLGCHSDNNLRNFKV